MSVVKMKGIIIAENNMGDFDKMLTMLTIFVFWGICNV